MVAVANEVLDVLERFLKIIKNAGINVDRAVLFGSYAKGHQNKWSDIDIAIVSPEFSGIAFYDRKRLNPFLLKVDTRIEIHPFRPDDFIEDNKFVIAILKNGVELKI